MRLIGLDLEREEIPGWNALHLGLLGVRFSVIAFDHGGVNVSIWVEWIADACWSWDSRE